MKKMKFILSGGGTGGHIYPAIAIADELKHRFPDAEFLFVGAQDRMEMQKVPVAGYKIEGLWISGLQRKVDAKNLMFPFKLLKSLVQSKKIIKRFQPDVVVGTGGFASGPLLKMAAQKHIPTLIQEQNSYAGITNKWLAKQTSVICVAYENMERFFPKDKIILTGNPVRKELVKSMADKSDALKHFQLDPHKKTLLVLGGSLGSLKINETIAANLQQLLDMDIQIIWQCGKLYHNRLKKYEDKPGVFLGAFIDRMDWAYAAADFVISRSGAISVSELCLVGKPVLFIPSPNVAEDHQTKNAQALVDKNAALLLKESDIQESFLPKIAELIQNQSLQESLSTEIKKMARPHATQQIVDQIEKLIKIES